MNDPVNHPPDDANDPLLAALRVRLGDYGAPPPPGAWAGIRQRLPLAPARPWWRRPRRLLPLLALLLFTAALTGYLLRRPGGLPGALNNARTRSTALTRVAAGVVPNGRTPAASRQSSSRPLRPGTKLPVSAAAGVATAGPVPTVTGPVTAAKLATTLPPGASGRARAPLATANNGYRSAIAPRPDSKQLSSGADSHKNLSDKTLSDKLSISSLSTKPATARPNTGYLASRQLAASPAAGAAKLRSPAEPTSVNRSRRKALALARGRLAARRASALTAAVFDSGRRRAPESNRLARPRRPHLPELPPPPAQWPARQRGRQLAETTSSTLAAAHQPRGSTSFLDSIQHVDGQNFHRARLARPAEASLPASLAARPDSSPPAPPVRRWALLATAGPTLSYRTIGAAPTALGTRPDFAHIERPAAGLGAQVQVRRVLSGRWALAVGLGYQEYATRLALQQVDSGRTTHFTLRDTYRLLTLPVQLSYALGAPRGPLARALLLGAEVGWYRGGRSTEGSSCACQQQAYTAAATDSLYSAKTLALSLGLDLRYRLGGPASRWQWLVQPTARYVLTPFVTPNTAGFSPRQPFSLGLFTGFSWDIR